MTDIPEDILAEAIGLVTKIGARQEATAVEKLGHLIPLGEWAADAIARAILAERERCARRAEQVGSFGDYTRDELTKDYGQPRFDMMSEIIDAIRTPSKATPTPELTVRAEQ